MEQQTAEQRPTRKRQRTAPGDDGFFVYDGSEMPTMTAQSFAIPIIRRSDMEQFRSIANKSMKQDENKTSQAITLSGGYAIAKAFEKYQAIYLPQYYSCNEESLRDKDATVGWKDFSGIFESLSESDKESFCIENESASKSFAHEETNTSSSFLQETTNDDNRVGYCSFMIQNDQKALTDLLQKLPLKDPVTADSNAAAAGWGYEPCLWIFFGRNRSPDKDLDGRPEHTDQISHDGTWHYQLSGTKRWLLRPTPQLMRSWKEEGADAIASNTEENCDTNNDESTNAEEEEEMEPKQMRIDCRQGDVLIVNTRLWRHQTILPPQTEPSISYARDFWIHKDKMKESESDAAANKGAMTNVDGLYAMDDIAEDTVIFREDDMPECELHRSSEANCKVVQLEDGIHAVVSCKFIKAGEFFCIPDSDDEEEDSDEEEGWWEESADCKIVPTEAAQ